jgi:uncharacterized membrane protein YeaQ/YmgE (transglycosylase-associated protein family)
MRPHGRIPFHASSTAQEKQAMSGILYTILIGAVIGILARLIKPGVDAMGWVLTIVLGIAGAWLGSYVAPMLGLSGGITGFAVSIACAVALLFLFELLRKKSR